MRKLAIYENNQLLFKIIIIFYCGGNGKFHKYTLNVNEKKSSSRVLFAVYRKWE